MVNKASTMKQKRKQKKSIKVYEKAIKIMFLKKNLTLTKTCLKVKKSYKTKEFCNNRKVVKKTLFNCAQFLQSILTNNLE